MDKIKQLFYKCKKSKLEQKKYEQFHSFNKCDNQKVLNKMFSKSTEKN